MLNILTKLVATNAARYGEREAFSCQYPGSDEWVPTSWNELRRQSEAAACALETLGVEPQEMLAIFASNCPEILVTDFGAYANRAVPVSIYSTSSPEQVSYIVRDAGARIIFVGEQRHYDAARSIAAECPTLERIVCFDPEVSIDADDATTMRWADFIALGEAASQMCREDVAARSEAATPDDIFTLIYTSGTTDVAAIVESIKAGDKKAELVLNGMIYSIAKWIGGSAVVLKGQVDAILLTGGVAYSDYVIERLSEYIGFIAPISVYPGENEMLALAANGLGALQGTIEVKEYK